MYEIVQIVFIIIIKWNDLHKPHQSLDLKSCSLKNIKEMFSIVLRHVSPNGSRVYIKGRKSVLLFPSHITYRGANHFKTKNALFLKCNLFGKKRPCHITWIKCCICCSFSMLLFAVPEFRSLEISSNSID